MGIYVNEIAPCQWLPTGKEERQATLVGNLIKQINPLPEF
jgi:hypothetical protein